jgi:hypothetical protein
MEFSENEKGMVRFFRKLTLNKQNCTSTVCANFFLPFMKKQPECQLPI